MQTVHLRKRLAYRYDLHGLIQIVSTVRVPQLAYFDQSRPGPPQMDMISIYVEDKLASRGGVRQVGRNFWYDDKTDELTYAPPRLPKSLRVSVKLGRNSVIRLSRSFYNASLTFRTRFDLYNILMAVLSTRLLINGYKLQYSACVSIDSRGVLLPAFSDIGKTTTVLSLVRKGAAQYVSDDATIIDPMGYALCLPTAVRPGGSGGGGTAPRADAARNAAEKICQALKEVYPFGGVLPSAPRNPSSYSLFVDRTSIVDRVRVASVCFLEWGESGSRTIDVQTALNRLWALDLFEPTWFSNMMVAAYGYARPDLDFGELLVKDVGITRKFAESVGRFRVISYSGKDFSEPVLQHFREDAAS